MSITSDTKTNLTEAPSRETSSASASAGSSLGFAWLTTIIFAIAATIGVLRHELWRDEGQAWLIALQSTSLPNLFQNMRYEMHPAVWHLMLFAITRFTHAPLAMQLLHVTIISSAIFLFLRFSPFSKFQKLVFCLGYFPFYEYAVISRSYSIVMLVLFAICSLWQRRQKLFLQIFLLLSLLANTNAYGFLLSGVVAATLCLESALERGSLSKKSITCLLIGTAFYVVSLGIALLQLMPPADGCSGEWNNKPVTVQESRLNKTIDTVWASYVPLPDLTTYNTWNTNILSPTGWAPAEVPLSIGLVALACMIFSKRRYVLFLYGFGTAVLLAFAYLKLLGGVRQQGHLFELLVISYWLSSYYDESKPLLNGRLFDRKGVVAKAFLVTLLVIQAAAGVFAYQADLTRPFSASALAANYLKSNHLIDELIIGTNDHEIIPISALIDRKIYYPESKTFGSFVRNDRSRHTLTFDETFVRVKAIMTKMNRSTAILITNYPLGGFPQGVNVEVLSVFAKAIQPDEIFYIYRLKLKDAGATPHPISDQTK